MCAGFAAADYHELAVDALRCQIDSTCVDCQRVGLDVDRRGSLTSIESAQIGYEGLDQKPATRSQVRRNRTEATQLGIMCE